MNFKFITDDELGAIERASFDMLANIGIRTSSERLKTVLADAGGIIAQENIRLPQEMVQQHIQYCPDTVKLWKRDGSHAIAIGGAGVFTQSCVGTPAIIDLVSGQARDCRMSDVKAFARLADALPFIDVISPVFPLDIPSQAVGVSQVLGLLESTVKPLRLALETNHELPAIIEMLTIVAGDRAALQSKPSAYMEVSPISPLEYGRETAEALIDIVTSGLPLGIIPAVMMGATGPMTMAGCVAMHYAEILAGVVAAQAIRPGAPVLMSPRATAMDMHSGLGLWAMPETGMMAAICAQLSRRAAIPCTTNGFTTCSKTPDSQAAYEHLYNALIPAMSGAGIIAAAGSLNNALISCYAMLVMDNEIASVIKRTLDPCEVNETTLAVQVVANACAGSRQFLDQEHTAAHLRSPGLWRPPLSNRQDFEAWAADSEKIETRARREARRILETGIENPLPAHQLSELTRIVALNSKK